MSDLQAYKRGGTLPSLPSVPPRSSPFFRAQHSFEPPAAASNTNISTSNTTSSREEAKDLLGRDTREISAGCRLKCSVHLLSHFDTFLPQKFTNIRRALLCSREHWLSSAKRWAMSLEMNRNCDRPVPGERHLGRARGP